jgi:hypothetical protein
VLNTLVSELFRNRTHRADKVFVHPSFDPTLSASAHDIAILRPEQNPENDRFHEKSFRRSSEGSVTRSGETSPCGRIFMALRAVFFKKFFSLPN